MNETVYQTLSDLCSGRAAVIRRLHLSGAIERRLRELGFIEGAKVTCLGTAPGGDPTAFQIRGAVIALRRADSTRIEVDACR